MARTLVTRVHIEPGDVPQVDVFGPYLSVMVDGNVLHPSIDFPSINECERWADSLLHQIVCLKAQLRSEMADDDYDARCDAAVA